jgi:large subunit ribosomal protein L24
MHIKKGDKVIVITGKEKGKTSTVVSVIREKNRVVLEGLNLVKKHTKPAKAGEKGGIISVAMSMHASNVKLADKTAVKAKPAAKAKKAVAKKATKKAE